MLYVSVGLDACLVFVEAHVGIKSRHANVKTRISRDVIGVGFPESAYAKNVFRQVDHIDVVVVGASHGCVQISASATRWHSVPPPQIQKKIDTLIFLILFYTRRTDSGTESLVTSVKKLTQYFRPDFFEKDIQ